MLIRGLVTVDVFHGPFPFDFLFYPLMFFLAAISSLSSHFSLSPYLSPLHLYNLLTSLTSPFPTLLSYFLAFDHFVWHNIGYS